MSNERNGVPLTPEQEKMLADIGQQAGPQLANVGALHHHISWMMKLLGVDMETLPEGDFVFALTLKRVGEATYINQWTLEKVEPDDIVLVTPGTGEEA